MYKFIWINPIWTGLFQPKETWGAGKMTPSPRNFAISSQITMKLVKVIRWVEIFTNSSC